MTRYLALTFALSGGLLCVAASSARAADRTRGAYRWVDDQGVTHYADSLPPAAAQQERARLASHGQVRRVLPAPQSTAQRQADARSQAASQHRDDYDRFLRETYASTADIENARDQRLASVDHRLQSARDVAEQNRATLKQLVARINAGDADAELKSSRDAYDAAVKDDTAAVATLQAQRAQLAEQFAHDLQRFRQLQGGSATVPTTAPSN